MKTIKLFEIDRCLHHIIDLIRYILNKNNINCIIDNCIQLDDDHDIWLGIFNDGKTPKKYIMLNTEPLNLEHWNNILKKVIKNAIFIIDYSYGNENIYKSMNIDNYIILPIGYCELHENIHNSCEKSKEQDIDIMFYGSLTDRRKDILSNLTQFSKENNINLVIRNNNLYDYNEKSQLLSRTKIVITIASREPELLKTNDMFRLSFLLSNKIFFITEKIGDTVVEDDIFGKYIEYYKTIEELKLKIIQYLKCPEEREKKSQLLYDFSKHNFNIENMFPIDKLKSFLD